MTKTKTKTAAVRLPVIGYTGRVHPVAQFDIHERVHDVIGTPNGVIVRRVYDLYEGGELVFSGIPALDTAKAAARDPESRDYNQFYVVPVLYPNGRPAPRQKSRGY